MADQPTDAATALYGKTAPPLPTRPDDQAREPHEEAAKALYHAPQPLPTRPGELHAPFALMQAQQHAARFYEQTGEHLDVDHYRVLDDVGLDAGLEAALVTADVDNLLAEARVPEDAAAEESAWEQRAAADMAETRRRAVAQYGPTDGPDPIDRTIRWVRTQPALAEMLRQRGLGARPDIAEQLIHHVFHHGIR